MKTKTGNPDVATSSANSIMSSGETVGEETLNQFNDEGGTEPTGNEDIPTDVEGEGEGEENSTETENQGQEGQEGEGEGEQNKGEDNVLKFSDFLARKNGVETDAALAGKGDKEKQENKETQEGQEGNNNPPPKKPRDYSGIDPADVPLFKNMSGAAFDRMKPLYLEKKAGTLNKQTTPAADKYGNLPPSYYTNKEAYKLTPEYEQKAYLKNLSERVVSHWATQEAKLRRGEKIQDISFDPNTKDLVVHEPKDATVEDEVKIFKLRAQAQGHYDKFSKEHDDYVNNFATRVEEDIQVIRAAEEKFFPGYSDENHPTRPIQQEVINRFPPSFRDNPVTSMLAKVVADHSITAGKLKAAEAKIRKLEGIKSDAGKALPAKGKFVAGAPTGSKNIKFSDFAARRNSS